MCGTCANLVYLLFKLDRDKRHSWTSWLKGIDHDWGLSYLQLLEQSHVYAVDTAVVDAVTVDQCYFFMSRIYTKMKMIVLP